MTKYAVILHTHLGRQFIVEADSEEEAIEVANRGYVEEGDDGTVEYETVEDVEVEEMK